MIQRVVDHSLDVSLLNRGYVLDGGARGFEFSRAIVKLGCKVIALDPGADITPPADSAITFHREALVARSNGMEIFCDGLGNFSHGSHLNRVFSYIESCGNQLVVPTTDLVKLSRQYNIQQWDLIKLDIEGAEYEILESLDRPVAAQLSVEFHTIGSGRKYPDFTPLLNHLKQWYDVVVFGETLLNGYPGYWDSLFIMKT